MSVCGQSFVLFVWGEGYAMVSRPVFSFHNCELQDEFLDRRQFGAGTEKAKTGGGSDFNLSILAVFKYTHRLPLGTVFIPFRRLDG